MSKATKIQLDLAQQFAIERISRAIEEVESPEEIRAIAKEFLINWQLQKAATNWVINHASQVVREQLRKHSEASS